METKPHGVELSEAQEAAAEPAEGQQPHDVRTSFWLVPPLKGAAMGLALGVVLWSSFLKVPLSFPEGLGPLSP